MTGFEEIEHTADRAIRVRAPNLPELFAIAAVGMFGPIIGPKSITVQRHFDIELEALDQETLLVDWLNELLYLAEVHDMVFVEFEILALNTDRDAAKLQARCGAGIPGMLRQTIKAATFNGLEIRHAGGEYIAEIVFDV